jgi:hypothetical protein
MKVAIQPGRHPFGGCDKTLGHYQTVGKELLSFEEKRTLRGQGISRLIAEFRVGVSFVPVEVLELYLDDLLDVGTSEESLFIERSKRSKIFNVLLLGIFVAMFAAVIFFASKGNAYLQVAIIPMGVAVAFSLAWYLSPYSGVARRLGFARILSQEISRRRGGHAESEISFNASRALRGIFSPARPETAKGAALEIVK